MVDDETKILVRKGFLSLFPGGGAFDAAVDVYIHNKSKEALEILLDELAKGNVDPDELLWGEKYVGLVHRYTIATFEGRAARNLRLLARVITNNIVNEIEDLDEFDKYKPILQDLTKEEILILGSFYRNIKKARQMKKDTVWQNTYAYANMKKEIYPKYFPSEPYLKAVFSGLSRTGMFTPTQITNGPALEFSVLGDRVCETVRFGEIED